MKKFIQTFTLFLSISKASIGQFIGAGFTGGMSHFIGDVGHYGIHVPQGYNIGASAIYGIDPHYSIELSGIYGVVSNDDALSSIQWRQNRNLSFRSFVYEASGRVNFNFFPVTLKKGENHSPFIFLGYGIFAFYPEAWYQNRWVKLRPLGTEGQGTLLSNTGIYPETSSFILFGFGYTIALSPIVNVYLETGFRRTATDYLDDVSGFYVDAGELAEIRGPVAAELSNRSIIRYDTTDRLRGNPNNNDWYVFSNFKIIFKLSSSREKCTRGW
ncbi:DUF6089 family protein [Schleiferia thermophila]|jgi:hypothetical protein|uniref:DUF6089 domain-containing protein n=1 Tax=Schleiferia thermophila TaxID=884107 RepID=A0A369A6H7_9FLAO|nr:DUF6089 family protein [Schleiferia thermophila]KFD38840.1 hypothetical protein AT05_07945 [Schleiferia thermophila str. Yellowstone]PMB35874.1 hypothetical protein CEN47_08830 [Fischerella thermalis CCMEE 5319]RCX04765.1 hypothetical protein DES35_10135 [Schleiferia thermophila]GCD79706.1 hypothetical protein JCM30197_09530 [Schleiferia thermophila]